MTVHHYIPEGYTRIKVVGDLCSFIMTDFEPFANVVLFPRALTGDFDRLAHRMAAYFKLDQDEIFIKYDDLAKIEEFKESLEEEHLIQCMNIILDDMEFLSSGGVRVHMRLLNGYKQDERTHKFHVDGLAQDFDRYMTCYNDPVTQYIRNDDVIKVDGHDVIYNQDAPVCQFKKGDMWKARVRNKPKKAVLRFIENMLRVKERRAFVHRAPKSDKARIMVVGDKRLS